MSPVAPRPPVIDEGEPVSVAVVVLEMLAPSRDRLRSSLLVLVPMLLVLAIWETFRLPQPAIATFLLLMIARSDAASSIGSSVSVALTVSLGALIAIVVVSCSLSQPALRVPLTALSTFTTMLLVRGTTLGPAVFITGFFATFGSTQADNLLGLALSTGDVTNTERFGRPQIDYFPPEEALLHALLWLSMAAAIPALLLAVTERLAGADPRRLLLTRLRARTDAVAAFCRGQAGAADRLRALGREGIAPLLDLMGGAERTHGSGRLHDSHLRLTRELNRLVLLLVAWDMARPAGADEIPFLRPIAEFCAALAARLQPPHGADATLPPPPRQGAEDGLGGALPSLAAQIRIVLDALRAAEAERAGARTPAVAQRRSRPLWQPNALGAANVRFALKVTLALMTCYLVENGLAWEGLSSSVVTCFFGALGTIGETVHKATLRIVGCLIGAALGLGSILLLMPSMTGFAQLAILFAPVAFASAWIGFGSPRIGYPGWQMLLAVAQTTRPGVGPTLDMETARDRVLGILLGNLVTTLVFLFVWPVPVGDAVRRDLAGALQVLARLMALEGDLSGPAARLATESGLRDSFVAAVTRVGSVIPNDRFEPVRVSRSGAGQLGRDALARLSRLIVPVSAIATDGVEPSQRDTIPRQFRDDVRGYHDAMQDWFEQAAAWIRTGERWNRLRPTLPHPPSLDDLPMTMAPALGRRLRGRVALYALMASQINDFLDDALPSDASVPAIRGERSASLAAG